MKKHTWWAPVLLFLVTGLVMIVLIGFDIRLTVRRYTMLSENLTGGVRIALLTDLHSCNYGEGQRELLDAVAAEDPDLVFLSGDIVDDGHNMPRERAYRTVQALAERWPTYYVSGNHEFRSGAEEEMFAALADCGAVVLRGETVALAAAGQSILLAGIDDPDVGNTAWARQLSAVTAALERVPEEGSPFTILLSHRPERVEQYQQAGYDLVLAGHAHGGQWAIPGLINGLVAPNQGFFPKYAGGMYKLGAEVTMVVSRGLARESTRIPRFFNPPELVVLELGPKQK